MTYALIKCCYIKKIDLIFQLLFSILIYSNLGDLTECNHISNLTDRSLLNIPVILVNESMSKLLDNKSNIKESSSSGFNNEETLTVDLEIILNSSSTIKHEVNDDSKFKMANESKRHVLNNDLNDLVKHEDLVLDEHKENDELNDQDGDGLDDNAIIKTIDFKNEHESNLLGQHHRQEYNENFLTNNIIVENDENEDNGKNDHALNYKMTTSFLIVKQEIAEYQEIDNNKTINKKFDSNLESHYQSELETAITNTSKIISNDEFKTNNSDTKSVFSTSTLQILSSSSTDLINTKSLFEPTSSTKIDIISTTTVISSSTDQNKNNMTSTPNKDNPQFLKCINSCGTDHDCVRTKCLADSTYFG